jgi:hypothetical protein
MTDLQAFNALPETIKSMFVNASSGNSYTAFEWFTHLVPDSLRDNPDEIEVFMNGGDITLVREIGDRGVAGGGYTETETITMPDRDISHRVSDHNGGDMSPDNTVMEDMSVNRSRGADNMTDAEYAEVMEVNSVDAELIDGSLIGDATEVIAEAESVAGEVFGTVLEALVPATLGAAVGMHVANKFEDTTDKVGWGSMAAGGTVLACLTPPGQIALAGYAAWNIGKLAYRGLQWAADQ